MLHSFDLYHPISDPDMGLNILRCSRSLFKLFSQSHHKNAKGSNVIVPAAAPDILGYISMRQHFSGIFGKKAEELEFNRGKLQLFSVKEGTPCGMIDLKVPVCIY